MKNYEISCLGYEVTVSAASYATAISRALRVLKRNKILKENSYSIMLRAKISEEKKDGGNPVPD